MSAAATLPQAADSASGHLTPERIFNVINAHQQTEALKAALELDVFTAIAEGNSSAQAIAKRCGCAERGMRILCDFLTVHRFLAKSDAQYSLTPESALFLDRRSPGYMGSAIQFLLAAHLRQAHTSLTQAVRQGGSALSREGLLQPNNPDWVQFARSMMPLMAVPARTMAEELARSGPATKVLDIAAGHGMYGIAVAQQNPDAQVYASDWANVLEVAQENARAMGLDGRYHLIPGSSFDVDLGAGYDLVLVPNFLHHFDPPTCTAFLRKVREAMVPSGRVAVVELVPNPDRVSPPTAAAFSVMMLATTPAGDAYTFSELEAMLTDAGFTGVELAQTPIGIDRLVVAYR